MSLVKSTWRRHLLASLLVAGSLFYFLLFAQFGFLHRLESFPKITDRLGWIMGAMGFGGILGSILAATLFRPQRAKSLLSAGFLGSAVIAGFAVLNTSLFGFLLAGSFIGLTLGLLTVSIVPTLRLLLPRDRLGLWTGGGVGFAYALSNLPPFFHGSATVQCLAVAVSSGILGTVCLFLSCFEADKNSAPVETVVNPKRNDAPFGFPAVILAFFILIWLDSAVFLVLQETAAIHNRAWATDSQLWIYGALHFLFALGSGYLQDRGFGNLALAAALCGLIGGSLLLHFGQNAGAAAYVVGVSLYSTPLVTWCAREAPEGSGSSRLIARRAALLYAMAGWIGSALGIGMAQDLHRVPISFLVTATVVFGLSLLWQVSRFCRLPKEFLTS